MHSKYGVIVVVLLVMFSLASCTPKILSLTPYSKGDCKRYVEVVYVDELDMRRKCALNTRKVDKPRKVIYRTSNEGSEGVCEQCKYIYSREAKDGFLYINRFVNDSTPRWSYFSYAIDGKTIVKEKDFDKVVKLRKRKILEISYDSTKSIVNINTKRK